MGQFSNQGFGSAIDISDDGTILVVGDPVADAKNQTTVGRVYPYAWNGDDWESNDDESSPLTGSEGSKFGKAIGLTQDGLGLIVGSPYSANGEGSVDLFSFVGIS